MEAERDFARLYAERRWADHTVTVRLGRMIQAAPAGVEAA
jgi:hypothetical protein